jgi:hypothetical protein
MKKLVPGLLAPVVAIWGEAFHSMQLLSFRVKLLI